MKLIIALRNYVNARKDIESILKTKQLIGSLSMFKVHQLPGHKELENIMLKIVMGFSYD